VIGPRGYELIKRFEGCKLKAYKCAAGVWTIGWGTTRIQGQPVRPGLVISQDEADLLLQIDAEAHWAEAEKFLRDPQALMQCQIDALASLIFNIGVGAFRRSTILKLINKGDAAAAAEEFLKWNKARGKVLRGLTRRRHTERKLFLEALREYPV